MSNEGKTDSTDGSEKSLEIWDSISQHSGWEEWMAEKQRWDDYKEWLEEEKYRLKETECEQSTSGSLPEAQENLEVTIQDIEKHRKIAKTQEIIGSRSDSSGSLPSRFTIDTNTEPEIKILNREKSETDVTK